MLRRLVVALALALGVLVSACGSPRLEDSARAGGDPIAATPPPLILVSFDAFRWDFMQRTETPHLDRLAAAGVRAERLIPSFPSKTFPNHYTLVTGLYPGHHGLVANNIWDPETRTSFTLGNRREVRNGRWYGGEPIWVTAERQGLRTSPHFWPGSTAEIGGVRPSFVDRYDGGVGNGERVVLLLERLALPPAERPTFATLYFSVIDDAAHDYDPDVAPEVAQAVRQADALVGELIAGLERLGLEANVILVSDHGMAANSPERAIALDRFVDLETANVVDWNPVAALWPDPGETEAIYRQLVDAHPHLEVYRRGEAPARYHYDHPRTPPILAVADEGWIITTTDALESPESLPRGSHGYDPELESMGALFVASGPAFRAGYVAAPFENVHLYEMMCFILGIEPAPNDGDLGAVAHLLAAWDPLDPQALDRAPATVTTSKPD